MAGTNFTKTVNIYINSFSKDWAKILKKFIYYSFYCIITLSSNFISLFFRYSRIPLGDLKLNFKM